ncbi:condensin, XCAP-G'-subunit [Culex quinquefasciatus]|uniref:Condensin, XCAP-G'-subunit n=1 Tax=Culex quinquefasciatus TaxID=7176 RepID=B0WQQ5_CULQU|nr:condensin, XCAP-G'-subunit [Culex quinquefasciatus]|eukprot:XP_001851039.1 condensin, XCAP-G'-subunit [Culex quinquefasciatus]
MVDLTAFCNYIKTFADTPTLCSYIRQLAYDPSMTTDKLQKMYFQSMMQVLLEIVAYDLGDERLVGEVEERFGSVLDLINAILGPSRADVSNTSRPLVDEYLEKNTDKSLQMKISSLRLNIMNLKEQDMDKFNKKDYGGAQRASDELTATMTYTSSLSGSCTNGTSRSLNTPNSTTFFFQRIMKVLKIIEMGRKNFDPSAPKFIPQNRLEIWLGCVSAVDEHQGGLMFNLDVSRRVLLQITDIRTFSVSICTRSSKWKTTKTLSQPALLVPTIIIQPRSHTLKTAALFPANTNTIAPTTPIKLHQCNRKIRIFTAEATLNR